MPNPVRIYVLHHPESKLGAKLTDRIYDWFRLPSLEGIPVYIRSVAAVPNGPPLPPASDGKNPKALEYLIPLVDAQMVRDPVWHDYLSALADQCQHTGAEAPPAHGWVMLPVALDSSAFNLPHDVSRRNFIRHGMGAAAAVAAGVSEEVLDVEETLKHLTEALARDLNGRLFPRQAAARFKIFISYARADGTEIAKALRDYIQGETQCQAFLDENDIAYGQAFDESLAANVEDLARAMIVVNGDKYADRPWCRWEIRNFTTPHEVALDGSRTRSGKGARNIYVFNPLLVVDAIRGPEMTRVVPELAQAPLVRWEPGRAKLCFSVLMREVLLGLKDVLVARQLLADDDLSQAIVVNRLPGPVALERLLRSRPPAALPIETIHHPGNGLPLIELRLLQQTFQGVRFRAFRDIIRESSLTLNQQVVTAQSMRQQLEGLESDAVAGWPLRGKVIVISTAYSARELAALGYLRQHQDEALIHLLRPLVRMGADLLFGGLPPTVEARPSSGSSWSASRNITNTLLQLLANERREDEERASGKSSRAARGSLLFDVPPWPLCLDVTPADEAAWINTCRILSIRPEDAGLPPWTQPVPLKTENPPPGYRRYAARTLSEMRRRLGATFQCRLPHDGERTICPDIFVFMGGALGGFSGIMPGIMEEFLHAAKTGRPLYLFGGLRGATGVIARALCSRDRVPPPELTADFYCGQKGTRKHADYDALLAELAAAGDPHPKTKFHELWSLIRKHRTGGLDQFFQNGLSHEDNVTLITTENTFRAVRLVWKGISQVPGMLVAPKAKAKARPQAARKSRPAPKK